MSYSTLLSLSHYHIELATEVVLKYVALNGKPTQSQNSVNIDKVQLPAN